MAPNSLELAESLSNIGGVEQQLGDLTKSEEHLRSALAIADMLSPESLVTAGILNRLGNVAIERGNVAEAQQWLQRSLDIRLKVAPDSREVGLSLIALGNLYGRRGEAAKEEEYFRSAQRVGEKLIPIEYAAVLDGLGDTEYSRGDLANAQQSYLRALEIRQKVQPGGLNVALSFIKLGMVAQNRGDSEKAEEYFRSSLEIRQKLAPGSVSVAAGLKCLGSIDQQRGNLAQAERHFRQALEIEQHVAPNSLAEAQSLQNLGVVFWMRNDLFQADTYFHQARDIRQRLLPDGPDLADSLNWVGLISLRRGDLSQAEGLFHQALEISEKASPESLAVSQMLKGLGDVEDRRGNFARAEEYFLRALAIQDKHAHGGPTAAFTLRKLSDLAWKRGDLSHAERYLREALAIWERTGPGGLAHIQALFTLGLMQHRQQHLESAGELYAQAMRLLDREMEQLGGSDDVRSDFRAHNEFFYKNYVDLLIEQKQPELAFHVLEQSRARTLLELLKSARIDTRHGCDPELLRSERSLRKSINAKSSYRLRLLEAGTTAEGLVELNKEIEELEKKYQEIETEIRFLSPGYAPLSQPQPLTAREVQQSLLDEDTILLEYSLGERHSHVWAITPTSLAVYDLPPRNVVESQATYVYDLLTERARRIENETPLLRRARLARAEAEYSGAAKKLSDMILAPVAALLEKKRLLIVSDGALQYLPFSALPAPEIPHSAGSSSSESVRASKDQSPPLVTEHEIVNLPSASALAELRRARLDRREPPKTVVVFADPVFDRRDERVASFQHNARAMTASPALSRVTLPPVRGLRLPVAPGAVRNGKLYLSRLLWTEREAASILKVTPPGQALKVVGFRANLATALSPSLARYRIVHFATHALLDSNNPEFSGLVLSLVDERGRPQNGFLDLQQIYNLNLPVDLVVLSACDAALGKEVRGEGLIGLARGFMYAGATRVMASLWGVDDEVTSELMARFYQALEQQKMSPAAALRYAQIEVAGQKRWSSPYYWAAFQIQGEWK